MATQTRAVDDGMLPFRLLAVQAAFRSFALVLFVGAVPAIFIGRFGSEALPVAFLLSATLVPLAVLAYALFERFLPAGLLVFGATLTSTVLIGWSWYAVSGQSRDWIAFLPMAMLSIPAAYTRRAADDQAELLYQADRKRRVLPRILAVSIIGLMLAGVAGPLSQVVGSDGRGSEQMVFGLSVFAAGAMTVTLGLLATSYAAQFSVRPTPKTQSKVNRARLGELWTDSFFRRVLYCYFLASLAGSMTYYLFLDVLSQRLSGDPEGVTGSRLIGFLVVHEAAWQVGAVTLLLIAGRPLLMRFGLRIGLALQPALVAIAALTLLILTFWSGASGGSLLVAAVTVRTLDVVLRRFATSPSLDVIQQVLPGRLRPAALVARAAGAGPLGVGAAGLLLLVATQLLDGNEGAVAALILAVTGLWLLAAIGTSAAYRSRLRHRLTSPSLSELDIAVDSAETGQAAETLLTSTDPAQLAAGLGLLGVVGGAPYDVALVRLLQTLDDPEALLQVIRRVASARPDGAVPGLVAQLASDTRSDVSVAAMSALIACEPYGGGTVIRPLLKSKGSAVRYGAIRALLQGAVLRHHDPAMSELADLATSDDQQDRMAACTIIGETGPAGAAELLATLLRDHDGLVRSAAIVAVGRLGLAGHAPTVLAALDHPATRRSAAKTLAGFGNGAVPSAADALAHGEMPEHRAVRMFGAFATAPTPGTTTLMATNIQHQSPAIRAAAISALPGNPCLDSPRLALPNKIDRLLQPAIAAEAARSGELFRVVGLVSGEPSFRPVVRGISQLAESHLANVFSLLAARYRVPSLQHAHHQIRAGGVGAMAARDLISATAGERDQETVGLLLGQRTSSRPGQAKGGDLAQVVASCDDDWITAAALYGAVLSSSDGDTIAGIARPGGEIGPWEKLVRGWSVALPPSALWLEQEPGRFRVLRRRNGKVLPMAVVEKVAVLRSCIVFRDLDDRQLAHIAEIGEQVTVGPKEQLCAAGGVSEAIYIVVDGLLETSVGGHVISTLSAGDTVDELTVFDGSPRAYDVGTVTAVELLRVARSDLLQLMDQLPELAVGVIAALATAAQDGAAKEAAAQDGAAKEAAAQDGAAKEAAAQDADDDPDETPEVIDRGDRSTAADASADSELSPSADAP